MTTVAHYRNVVAAPETWAIQSTQEMELQMARFFPSGPNALSAFVAILVTGVVMIYLGVAVSDAGAITATLITMHAAWQARQDSGADTEGGQ
ncbi:hypothetical protein [Streptomyces longisporus]|uniref:Uncharacterized protein n=1 Tax=Streptomyces longisporus TaxID=1948 RepID=A0ABN3N484_STRLO